MPDVRDANPTLDCRIGCALRLRLGSRARRGRAERQRPASTRKRLAGIRRKHGGKTTPHPSDWRHWTFAVPARTALTLDRAKSHRALQHWLRCRPPARPRYRQLAGPAAIGAPPTHPPTAQYRRCLPIRPLPGHPDDAQHEVGKVGRQLRERDDRTGNRGEHVVSRRDDVRHRREHVGNRRHRISNRRHHRISNRRTTRTFGTAATGLGSAVTRPAFLASSVPPASILGLIAPVEGCWPGCRPEPSVLVAPVEGRWPGCAPEPGLPVTP